MVKKKFSLSDQYTDPSQDCRDAIAIGTKLLMTEFADHVQYKLISAENLIGTAEPHIWRLTFKLRRLIPKTPGSRIGAGGELFIEVDLSLDQARLCGYGE